MELCLSGLLDCPKGTWELGSWILRSRVCGLERFGCPCMYVCMYVLVKGLVGGVCVCVCVCVCVSGAPVSVLPAVYVLYHVSSCILFWDVC